MSLQHLYGIDRLDWSEWVDLYHVRLPELPSASLRLALGWRALDSAATVWLTAELKPRRQFLPFSSCDSQTVADARHVLNTHT